MPGTVYYTVELRDLFTAASQAIAKASATMKTAVNSAGGAVNGVEAAVAKAATALNSTAAAMQNVAKASGSARGGFAGVATEADRAAAAATKAAAAMRTAARDSAWGAKGFTRGSDGNWVPPPGRNAGDEGAVAGRHGSSGWNRLWHAWFGIEIARMGAHAVDSVIGRAGTVDTMRKKIGMALGPGSEGQVGEAYDKAFSLSGKYRNVSVAENLKIIDDLRANLPEKFDHILKESTEPFVRLHSFLKAYEGGKHAGQGESALKDIGIAIRSGELMGNLTGEQLAQHAQAIATGRVWFGDKFKIHEYFTAQKAASVAINAADDTFKHIDFPVMVQALGQRAGTSLATLYNKTVGGIMIRPQSAEAWRSLDMVDMNVEGLRLKKDGSIDPKSLAGKRWLKGGDVAGKNPLEWMMRVVLPQLGASGRVRGLDGEAMSKAWAAGDVDKLVELQSKIDRNDLSRALAPMGYDRNAIMAMEEMIMRSPAVLRDRQGFGQTKKDIENFNNYDKAKQTLSAQIDRLFQGLTGKDFMGTVIGGMDALSAGIKKSADYAKEHPLLGKALGIGIGGVALIGVAKLAGWLSRLVGLTSVLRVGWAGGRGLFSGFTAGMTAAAVGASRFRTLLRGLGRLTVFGGLAAGALDLYNALDKLDKKMNPPGDKTKGWGKIMEGLKGNKVPLGGAEAAEQGPGLWERMGNWFTRPSPGDIAVMTGANQIVGAGMQQQDVNVTVTIPPSVSIEVHGKMDGMITGSGSMPLSATTPRGEAAPASP